jgi:acyl-CoA dehydrogenase
VNAERHDRDGTFVQDGFELLHEHRMMSVLVPTELGGGDATHAEACAVIAELAKGCPATALSYSMHSHLVAAQVWRHHRGLPAPVLQRVAADQLCLISTGASDWLDSSGSATRVDGGYIVNARKMPASGCPAGDILVTSFRWDEAPEGPHVVHCSIPFSNDGVSIIESWDTMGMRGTGSHTVAVEQVFVPDSAVTLIRPAKVWHPVWATVLGAAVPLIMAAYIGVTEAAVERAVELASRRSERPEAVAQVGRMHNRLTAARDAVASMIASSNNLCFENTADHADVTLRRKTNATEACLDAVRLALEIGGGQAYGRGTIERMFRDVHGSIYHPLPTAKQEMFTGKHVL